MKWLKKVASTPLTTIARVVDNLNAQTNDRTNAPSIHAVREAVNNNWLSIYPIGSIYMSVNNVNPSEIFGGTWQQIKDKFLLACGDTYNNGATGGSATNSYTPAGEVGNHTLTVDEIPAHNHSVYTTGIQNGSGSWGSGLQGTGLGYITTSTGGGQAHNHSFTGTPATIDNMPPYLAVNVWVRTA
jgi:hypothetical protein